MLKTLIIAEKPDMGRNIAAAIEPKAKNYRSYLEGEQYIITWAIGHLIGLAEPEAYDNKYKNGTLMICRSSPRSSSCCPMHAPWIS